MHPLLSAGEGEPPTKFSNMFFSVITKDLTWEILTKNLVTFKIWDGVKDEKFYYGGSLKHLIFRGEVTQKPIYREVG